MRGTHLVCLAFAIAAVTAATPAAAQWASANSSWEGAITEMQKRGPGATIYGPDFAGRLLVTDPAYQYNYRYARRGHRAPAYGFYR